MRTFVLYYEDETERRIQSNDDIETVTERYLNRTDAANGKVVDQVGELTWHVFADNYDDFYAYESDARREYAKLCETRENVRLYWEISDAGGDTIEEDHVLGQGEFPL